MVGKTRTSRQLNLFKSLTILEGTKTAFSGVDTGSIQDRRVFSNRDKGNDPNMKQDDSTKSLNDVASFGQEFLKSVKGTQNKKKKAEKVGTEVTPDSGQN